MYSDVALPLTRLTSALVPFKWGDKESHTFNYLKKRLTESPILVAPNWSIIFHVHTDASLTAVGALLAQPSQEHSIDRPIYYASRLLTKAERNYSTTEREGLAIVYALQKFRHYLLATHFIVITDHHALKYLLNKP